MRRNVIRWRNKFSSTPRAADMGVQVLSRLLSFAQEEGKLMHNICNGVEGIYSADRSGLIWTDADLARLLDFQRALQTSVGWRLLQAVRRPFGRAW